MMSLPMIVRLSIFRRYSYLQLYLKRPSLLFGGNPYTFQQNKLFIKQSKCSFGKKQVEYLGHILSRDGVAIDPQKMSCMLEWSIPRNLKGLRNFLGLTRYYCKFIKDYVKISAPLIALLKQDSFQWSEMIESAFNDLKQAMISTLVLALLDFLKEFIILLKLALLKI